MLCCAEIIRDKSHVHLNATKWKSLTQYVAYLGKEGICKVDETEKGLHIAWIDNSPETLRKREALMKKERQDKGDEEREQKAIRQQVERAQRAAAERSAEKEKGDGEGEEKMLQRDDGEKVKLNFGFGGKQAHKGDGNGDAVESADVNANANVNATDATVANTDTPTTADPPSEPAPKISMSFGAQKPKNVFASGPKKNPLAGKKGPVLSAPKKMSEQERIMKAEMEAQERKRSRPAPGFNNKRPKISMS